MAGDTIQAAVRAFYRQQATPKNNASLPTEQILAGLVQALVAPVTQAATMRNMRMAAPDQVAAPGLTVNDVQALKQKDPKNINGDRPKAYLNYVFFDKQLNFVNGGSGVRQVSGNPDELETLNSGKVVAEKDGYVYIYTSNESQQVSLSRKRSCSGCSLPAETIVQAGLIILGSWILPGRSWNLPAVRQGNALLPGRPGHGRHQYGDAAEDSQ